MKQIKKPESDNQKLATAIILNRILQTDKSPAKKTHKQIAEKFNCDIKKVIRAEQFILQALANKIAVLKILIEIK